ncbi:ABC transporter permease [bacterium]
MNHNIEIVSILGLMDVKLKYQNSKLGFLWSFIKPLSQFLVYFTIFGLILKVGAGKEYPLRLFFGIIIWVFFSESTSLALTSFIGKKSIVTKIKVNNILIPISAYVAPLINFFLNFLVFFLIFHLLIENPSKIYTITKLLIFSFSFITLSMLIIALNILISNLNVLFRDIQQIWELILTYGVFLTPIIYNIPVPEKYRSLYYSLNLLVVPLENLKTVFFNYDVHLYKNPMLMFQHSSLVILLFVVSLLINKKLNKKVVDYL